MRDLRETRAGSARDARDHRRDEDVLEARRLLRTRGARPLARRGGPVLHRGRHAG
ncbi:MAG: hypothetical protein MZV63_23730 [Marinilabiliales bacterium]|nr:hypothetical protein [Marinilabiliales bacterium]